jgi:hypothetical protein
MYLSMLRYYCSCALDNAFVDINKSRQRDRDALGKAIVLVILHLIIPLSKSFARRGKMAIIQDW